MGLSKELISQFVKITKDDTKTKSEKTVYGTIVEKNGSKYIRLDGSDMITPALSTANAEDGERVIATIKNHSVIVTGNITSPSARTSEVVEVDKEVKSYLYHDSTNGLQIGDRSSGSWKGFRVQITNSVVNIRNALGTVLASYGDKLIELGKNATDAIISLCGGKGKIEYVTDKDDNDSYLQINADKLRMKSSSMSSLYSMYTNNSTRWEKSATNVSPTKVHMYASECIEPSLYDMIEGWNTTEVCVNPDGIDIFTPGNLRVNDHTIYGMTEGKSGIWSYRQWSNGTAELWGSYSVSNLACTTALGNMYRTAVFSPGSFPFTVYSPNVTASYESDGYGAMLWATTTATTSGPPSYYLVRPTSATISSGKINFHVRGKWTS
jgi:hypothetical protein